MSWIRIWIGISPYESGYDFYISIPDTNHWLQHVFPKPSQLRLSASIITIYIIYLHSSLDLNAWLKAVKGSIAEPPVPFWRRRLQLLIQNYWIIKFSSLGKYQYNNFRSSTHFFVHICVKFKFNCWLVSLEYFRKAFLNTGKSKKLGCKL